MLGRRGPAVVVKADVKPSESFLHLLVVGVDDFAGRGAVLFRTKRDGRTVFVAPTNPKHVFPRAPKVPNVDVRRQVRAGNVTEVNRPVGVGKRGSDHPPLGNVLRHGCKSTSASELLKLEGRFGLGKSPNLVQLTHLKHHPFTASSIRNCGNFGDPTSHNRRSSAFTLSTPGNAPTPEQSWP